MSNPIVKRFYLARAEEMIRQPQQKPSPHVHLEENSQGSAGTQLELCVVEASTHPRDSLSTRAPNECAETTTELQLPPASTAG